ncbi:MAG: type II toxin-antitoxin system Phd/YefM family antitoxin [Oscillospiraceae bacterium]|jgi:prevent-host-death family protein|nr:type II toxin-antitoxin system Phd/YefM family antitoxin [Oscillospiraceae bacterium]
MFQTQIKPSSQLRNNYAEMIKLVKERRAPVILTNNGKPDAVLVNMEDYAEFEKFMYRQYVREALAADDTSPAGRRTSPNAIAQGKTPIHLCGLPRVG